MARGIKYSANRVDKTIKKGNMASAVEPNVDYGPTSSTGFYSPIAPPAGGYTIYKNKASGGPSIYTATTDQQVINVARSIGGTSITTVESAFLWMAQQSDVIVVDDSGYDLVTDGLVILLDATRRMSYPGSGNIWYDLSGNGNNFTLYNTPDYVSRTLKFDGISDYAALPNNATLNFSRGQTLMFWMNHNITSGRRNIWDQAYGGYGTLTHESGGNFNYYFGDAGLNATPYIGFTSHSTPRNTWQFVTVTRDLTKALWYDNAVLTRSVNHSYADLLTDTNQIRIGVGYAGYWAGQIGQVIAYNRALEPGEIEFVFNQTKSKFI